MRHVARLPHLAYDTLRSRYLTIGLMLAVVAAAVVGLVYPQAGLVAPPEIVRWSSRHPILATVGKPLGATSIFTSWWFLAAAALLFSNGSLCVFEQTEKAIKLTRNGGFTLSARMAKRSVRARITKTNLEPAFALDAISRSLSSSGLRVRAGTHEGSPALLGVGRGWTQWGTVVFHAGLLFALASVVFASLTFAKGYFRVVVGGEFKDAPGAYEAYARGRLGPASLGGWDISLSRFDPSYRRGSFAPGPASNVLVLTESGVRIRRLLTRGEYFNVDGTNIFQSGTWGFAPVVTVTGPTGRSRTGAVLMRRGATGSLASAGFAIEPGAVGRAQMLQATKSTRFKPQLRLRLLRGRETVLDQKVSFEETVAAGGYRVSYDGFRYWSEFIVVRSPWLMGVNAAFWLLIVGASIMYFWPATYAWAVVRKEAGGSVVYLGGRRERFSRGFERLVNRVTSDLARAEEAGT